MDNWFFENPPTAGLPLSWRDFLPTRASFEQDLAIFLGKKDLQIECSGTAAIVVALTALKNTTSRRSVVIPAYTCPLVPFAILRCGLKPILCDTRPNHFDFCPESLKAVCNEDTLAVIPTHLGGRLADLKSATEIARSIGAYVVEDVAQALGASWQGQAAGTIGDIGCYSLGVGKGLTIYGGGAVIARNECMRQRLRNISAEIAPYQGASEVLRFLGLVGYYALYRPLGLKFAFGLPLRRKLKKNQLIAAVGDDCSVNFPLNKVGKLRKAIGARVLKRLPHFIAKTTEQAKYRKSLLANISGISFMDDKAGDSGTWPYFLVLMPSQKVRDLALSKLWVSGLGVGRLFIHALPDYDFLKTILNHANTPNARDFASRTLTISNSHWLSDRQFIYICSVLEQSVTYQK